MSDVYKNMAENIDTDVIADINVTNPLFKDETISKVIDLYFKNLDNFGSGISLKNSVKLYISQEQ